MEIEELPCVVSSGHYSLFSLLSLILMAHDLCQICKEYKCMYNFNNVWLRNQESTTREEELDLAFVSVTTSKYCRRSKHFIRNPSKWTENQHNSRNVDHDATSYTTARLVSSRINEKFLGMRPEYCQNVLEVAKLIRFDGLHTVYGLRNFKTDCLQNYSTFASLYLLNENLTKLHWIQAFRWILLKSFQQPGYSNGSCASRINWKWRSRIIWHPKD